MAQLCPNTRENYALLDYIPFCEEVRERVAEMLGEGYEAVIKSVIKNNQKEYRSIVIHEKEEGIMPTIRLEDFYRAYSGGMPLSEVVETVVKMYEENRNPWPNGFDFSFGGLREKITFRLVNHERNRRMLKKLPHVVMDEWAVYFTCVVARETGEVGAFRIDNSLAADWGVSLKDLVMLAVNNTFRMFPPKLQPIEEVLAGMLLARIEHSGLYSEEEKEQKKKEVIDSVLAGREGCMLPMYVLSNQVNNLGACSVLYLPFLDRIREKFGEDFYILPSSVHELILVPCSVAPEKDRLLKMVREVNENEVPEEEYLSDGVYRFSELRVKLADLYRDMLENTEVIVCPDSEEDSDTDPDDIEAYDGELDDPVSDK